MENSVFNFWLFETKTHRDTKKSTKQKQKSLSCLTVEVRVWAVICCGPQGVSDFVCTNTNNFTARQPNNNNRTGVIFFCSYLYEDFHFFLLLARKTALKLMWCLGFLCKTVGKYFIFHHKGNNKMFVWIKSLLGVRSRGRQINRLRFCNVFVNFLYGRVAYFSQLYR